MVAALREVEEETGYSRAPRPALGRVDISDPGPSPIETGRILGGARPPPANSSPTAKWTRCGGFPSPRRPTSCRIPWIARCSADSRLSRPTPTTVLWSGTPRREAGSDTRATTDPAPGCERPTPGRGARRRSSTRSAATASRRPTGRGARRRSSRWPRARTRPSGRIRCCPRRATPPTRRPAARGSARSPRSAERR